MEEPSNLLLIDLRSQPAEVAEGFAGKEQLTSALRNLDESIAERSFLNLALELTPSQLAVNGNPGAHATLTYGVWSIETRPPEMALALPRSNADCAVSVMLDPMPPNKLWIASFEVMGKAAGAGGAFIFGSQDINAQSVVQQVPVTGSRQTLAALFGVAPNGPPPQISINPLNLGSYVLYRFRLIDVFGS
jgi:hypothetical protein